MKKMSMLLVLSFMLCMVLPASAQMDVGVLGGLNLANLSVDPGIGADLKTRTGFGFGGVLGIGLGEMFSLEFEPMFLQKGAKAEAGGTDGKIKADYLEVPVMLKVPFGQGNVKPYVMAGPQVGYLLSAKVEAGGQEQDIKDDVKSIDFGVAFGAGVGIPAGNNTVFIEGRYALGLTDVNDDSNDPTEIKTKGIQIFAGITFPLGGK